MALPSASSGAPALLRPPAALGHAFSALNTAQLLVADAGIIKNLFAKSKWGIYKGGQLVIAADSVISLDYRQDTKVSDHPLEDGAFETYNKVGTPYDIRIRMTKGGSEADRAKFLSTCDMLVNSFDVYDVATPEKTYVNANVQRYDYARSATNGVGLLMVDITLIEIRRFAKAVKLKPAAPAGAASVNKGRVQARPVTDFVGKLPFGKNIAVPAVTNFVGVFK